MPLRRPAGEQCSRGCMRLNAKSKNNLLSPNMLTNHTCRWDFGFLFIYMYVYMYILHLVSGDSLGTIFSMSF